MAIKFTLDEIRQGDVYKGPSLAGQMTARLAKEEEDKKRRQAKYEKSLKALSQLEPGTRVNSWNNIVSRAEKGDFNAAELAAAIEESDLFPEIESRPAEEAPSSLAGWQKKALGGANVVKSVVEAPYKVAQYVNAANAEFMVQQAERALKDGRISQEKFDQINNAAVRTLREQTDIKETDTKEQVARKVVGRGAQTGLDIASLGTAKALSAGAKGIVGKLAKAGASAPGVGFKYGAGYGALENIATSDEVTAGGVATGAGVGAAAGTVLGGVLGGIGKLASKRAGGLESAADEIAEQTGRQVNRTPKLPAAGETTAARDARDELASVEAEIAAYAKGETPVPVKTTPISPLRSKASELASRQEAAIPGQRDFLLPETPGATTATTPDADRLRSLLRYRQKLLDRFEEAGDLTPDQVRDVAYKQAVEDGGVTITLAGKQPTAGFVYSPFKATEEIVDPVNFTPDTVAQFTQKNQKLLQDPGNHLGIWEDNGKIYLDISKVGDESAETLARAQANSQLGVYDIAGGDTIRVGDMADGVYTKLDEAPNIFGQYRGEVPAATPPGIATSTPEIPGGRPATAQSATTATARATTTAPGTTTPTATQAVVTPDDTPQTAIEKLNQKFQELPSLQRKQASLYRKERGQKFAASEKAMAGAEGREASAAALGAMKGQLTKVEYESLAGKLADEDVAAIYNIGRDSRRVTQPERLTLFNALNKVFGEEGATAPTKSEAEILRRVYGDFADTMLEKMPAFQGARELGLELVNVPRSLMATADISIPGRQSWPVIFTHPIKWAKNLGKSIDFLFNSGALTKAQKAIEADPLYDIAQKAKLDITQVGSLRKGEEEFLGAGILGKVPIIGQITKASNRNAVGFSNMLRFDLFKQQFLAAERAGLDPTNNIKLLRDIGKLTNTLTGRGDLGKAARFAPAFNATMFSPRLVKARLDLLNPVYYAKLHPQARKEALKTLFNASAATMTVLALAKARGAEVTADPRSADFGKIKVGNTRIDVAGGFSQYIRLAAQLATGIRVSSTTGEEQDLASGEFGAPNRGDVVARFIQSKFSPIASLVTDVFTGKDYSGRPFNAKRAIIDRMIPLAVQDTLDLYKDNPDNIPYAGLAFGGVGVQTYGKLDKGRAEETLGSDIASSSKLLGAIDSISAETGYSPGQPRKTIGEGKDQKKLNKDEYNSYIERSGKLLREEFDRAVKSKEWKQRSAEEREADLRYMVNRARKQAREELFGKIESSAPSARKY